jgi:hypothetical protein
LLHFKSEMEQMLISNEDRDKYFFDQKSEVEQMLISIKDRDKYFFDQKSEMGVYEIILALRR